jgi:hypothetical protein
MTAQLGVDACRSARRSWRRRLFELLMLSPFDRTTINHASKQRAAARTFCSLGLSPIIASSLQCRKTGTCPPSRRVCFAVRRCHTTASRYCPLSLRSQLLSHLDSHSHYDSSLRCLDRQISPPCHSGQAPSAPSAGGRAHRRPPRPH